MSGLDRFPGVLRAEVAAALGLSGRSLRRWRDRLEEGVVANEAPRRWAHTPGSQREALRRVSASARQSLVGLIGDASGLLIVSAHAGPRFVLVDLLRSIRHDLVVVTANPEQWGRDDRRSVANGDATVADVLRLQFLRLYTALGSGGVGLISPDGGRGEVGWPVEVLRTQVEISGAAAAMARTIGCDSVPVVATWARDQLAVDIAAPLVPTTSGSATSWDQEWVEGYAAWLEHVYRADPMNWRLPTALTLEFFERSAAVTEWHHDYNRMVARIRAASG
jgi:hypothetical protein